VAVSGARNLTLIGLALVAVSGPDSVPVVDADVKDLVVTSCLVAGSRGAGIGARGPGGGRLAIEDSDVRGNLAGGLRISGGLDLRRTLLVENGVAGLVFEGFAPQATLRLDHATFAENGTLDESIAIASDDDEVEARLSDRVEVAHSVIRGAFPAAIIRGGDATSRATTWSCRPKNP